MYGLPVVSIGYMVENSILGDKSQVFSFVSRCNH